jgi:hypothetical protein
LLIGEGNKFQLLPFNYSLHLFLDLLSLCLLILQDQLRRFPSLFFLYFFKAILLFLFSKDKLKFLLTLLLFLLLVLLVLEDGLSMRQFLVHLS